MSNEYPHFSDFAVAPQRLEGKKKKIAEILNIEILVTGYKTGKSKVKEGTNFLTLQFELDGETYIIFTGSGPLIDQAQESEEKMPYYTTIIQRGNYFTMT